MDTPQEDHPINAHPSPQPEPPHRHVVYVSGPMTGIDDFNYPAFHAAAQALRRAGYTVHCPADITMTIPNPQWSDYMRAALPMMMRCTAVALLDKWETSRGATLEVDIAHQLGMHVAPLEKFLSASCNRTLTA